MGSANPNNGQSVHSPRDIAPAHECSSKGASRGGVHVSTPPYAHSPRREPQLPHLRLNAPTAGFSLTASVSKSAMVSIRTSMAGVGARRAGITGANASMLGAIERAMIGSRYKGKRGGV